MKSIFKRHTTQNEEKEENNKDKNFKLHLYKSRSLNNRRLKMYLRKLKYE
jgi:hypothetical protein